jgi:hypothetical protein
MNDVFTPARNLLLLKTVSHITFLRNNRPPLQHFTQKDLFRVELEKEDAMLIL